MVFGLRWLATQLLSLGVLLVACGGCAHAPSVGPGNAVYFLPVWGDAILIDAGDTEILIDGGQRPRVLKKWLEATVTDGTIELVIITHADADHWKGLRRPKRDKAWYVGKDYAVGELWEPGYDEQQSRFLDAAGFDAAVDSVVDDGTRVWRPLEDGAFPDGPVQYGPISVEFLHPYAPPGTKRDTRNPKRISGTNAYKNNNASIVVRVELDGSAYLLTGDINGDPSKTKGQKDAAEVEGQLIADGRNLDAGVVKVAHHGSKTSSTIEFIEAVSPEFAVVPRRLIVPQRDVVNRYRVALCKNRERRCDKVLQTRAHAIRCAGNGTELKCAPVKQVRGGMSSRPRR